MDEKNFQISVEAAAKEKRKKIWTHIGFVAIAIALAVVTVFVLYLNRGAL